MKVCNKLCEGCPYSSKSVRGFLADYTLADFQDVMSSESLFPCHKTIAKTMPVSDANKLVVAGTSKLCRGYIESMIKSCKVPRSPELNDIVQGVKSDMSEDSMSMMDFMWHHDHDKLSN